MKKILTYSFLFSIHCHILSQDTFSIIVVDTMSGKIGSAGASCIQGSIIISDIYPGLGAIHTQSYWNETNQDSAGSLMIQGFSPQEIVDWLIENDSENNPSIRQYGIVDINDGSSRAAAHTGENCFDYKNHIVGDNYSIQGNILLGQEILDAMEDAFLHAYGSLEERMIASIMAANVAGADSRCAPYGTPAISAFIRIAQPNNSIDSLFLDINVDNAPLTINPLDSLFSLYWHWKQENYTLGDINWDSIVDIFDIMLLTDHLNGSLLIDGSFIFPADTNFNGSLEFSDLYLLLFQIIGVV